MRRLGVLLVLLVAPVAAGCLAGDEPRSQNVRTPRVVVDATPDNQTTLYLHAAFTSEELYDDLRLTLDNETVAAGNHTYALVHKTNASAFFLDVRVNDSGDRFRYQARLAVNASAGSLSVAPWEPEEAVLGEARNATLPFKKVIPSYDPQTVEE